MNLLTKTGKLFHQENSTINLITMKKKLTLAFSMACILTSCQKSYTCSCTESYDGANESYSNQIDEEIEGLKKNDAAEKCAEGNVGPQNLLGETWQISCELK